jgi:hypothetical protein
MPEETENQKSDIQIAAEAFDAADKAYKVYEDLLMTGNVMLALMQNRSEELTAEKAVLEFRMVIEKTKELLEDRNVKLRAVKDALRQSVQMAPSQWRNHDGKPTVQEYGDFVATSVTSRSFNAESLFLLLNRYPEHFAALRERTRLDKDGKRIPLLEQKWVIQYDEVLTYLKANNLIDVIHGSYDETEKTPQVKGPKPLMFLGDKEPS